MAQWYIGNANYDGIDPEREWNLDVWVSSINKARVLHYPHIMMVEFMGLSFCLRDGTYVIPDELDVDHCHPNMHLLIQSDST